MPSNAGRLSQTVEAEGLLWGRDVAHDYHGVAASQMDGQWRDYIQPFMDQYGFDLSRTLDFAAGFGRNTRKLFEAGAGHVTMVDLNPDCIKQLRKEFEGPRGRVIQNNGFDLGKVKTGSVTFFYSFDAMVHFDLEVIAAYMPEIARVLAPGGYALIHHSAYDANPGGDFRSNTHWRNFMNAAILKHLAVRGGLDVVEQRSVPWGGAPIDCISILRKP